MIEVKIQGLARSESGTLEWLPMLAIIHDGELCDHSMERIPEDGVTVLKGWGDSDGRGMEYCIAYGYIVPENELHRLGLYREHAQ